MTRTLIHRGPDDEGILVAGACGFGFRRLEIIDLVSGQQPMVNEDGNVVMICNGEIFNHLRLRSELESKGHVFRSHTDVEVVLHLYEELGEHVVERLRGQFAFALYDRRLRRLVLGRDHFGVNPLYYTRVNGAFLFASEIKALLAHPGVERRLSITGLDQILSLPGLVSPRTAFEGILGLPPGHLLVIEDGRERLISYWDVMYPRAQDAEPARPEQIEELESYLRDAVAGRLQADVPVGAYLSGGLDSSLITGMMKDLSGGTRETFSIALREEYFDETSYQKLVCEQLGFRHNQVDFSISDIAAHLRTVIRHCECPLKESYNAASLALSRAAYERGIRVVLSGEGADELFAGYPSYRFDAFRRRQGRAAPVFGREADLRARLWGDPSFFYEKDLAKHEVMRKRLYSRRIADSFEEFEFSRFGIIDTSRVTDLHPLHLRSYLDLKVRLADHLVADHGDRMLMANSVEGRYPFLDVEVAELAMRMAPELKLNGYEEKYALKKLAPRYVPQAIVSREKFGFVTPGTPHLLQGGDEWALDQLSYDRIARQGYFDADEIEQLKARYMAPGFLLNLPLEEDLLMVVLTTSVFLEEFDLPDA